MTHSTGPLRRVTLAALLALVLALALGLGLGAGTTYAAHKVHLPKSSVASKQVKNGSLQGKDIKDGSITSADLAPGTIKEPADTRLFMTTDVVGDNQPTTFFSDPTIGSTAVDCSTAESFTFKGTLAGAATPGSLYVEGSSPTDTLSLQSGGVTASTPGNGGGSSFGFADQVVVTGTAFFDTPTKRVDVQWAWTTGAPCTIRGEVTITDK